MQKGSLLIATLSLCMVVFTMAAPPVPFPNSGPINNDSLPANCKVQSCPIGRHTDLPYPLDCLAYAHCDGTSSVPQLKYCPDAKQFNKELGACDVPAKANCKQCW